MSKDVKIPSVCQLELAGYDLSFVDWRGKKQM